MRIQNASPALSMLQVTPLRRGPTPPPGSQQRVLGSLSLERSKRSNSLTLLISQSSYRSSSKTAASLSALNARLEGVFRNKISSMESRSKDLLPSLRRSQQTESKLWSTRPDFAHIPYSISLLDRNQDLLCCLQATNLQDCICRCHPFDHRERNWT